MACAPAAGNPRPRRAARRRSQSLELNLPEVARPRGLEDQLYPSLIGRPQELPCDVKESSVPGAARCRKLQPLGALGKERPVRRCRLGGKRPASAPNGQEMLEKVKNDETTEEQGQVVAEVDIAEELQQLPEKNENSAETMEKRETDSFEVKELQSAAAKAAVPSASPREVRIVETHPKDQQAKIVNRQAFQACRKDVDIRSVYDWEHRKALGSGSFGQVFAVKHRLHSKKHVAIKQVSKDACEHLEQLRMEITVLSTLDHPRILHFFEAYEDFKDIYIVTELCTGGDLQQCMTKMQGNLVFARHTADQILRALIYCHSRGVCHRDLKPENVLLVRKVHSANDTPMRLADFGLSHKTKASQGNICNQISHIKSRFSEASMNDMPPLDSFVGTAEYMAPEVMSVLNAEMQGGKRRKFYDFRCDIWSLGVIIYCLLKGDPPYALEELVAYVEEQTELPSWTGDRVKGVTSEALDFLQRCLAVPYKTRPSARQLAADPFLKTQESETGAFASVDKDGSGTVDMQELRDYLLSHGQMNQQKEEQVEELFTRLDLNQDGIITKSEFQKGFNAFIDTKAQTKSSEVMSDIIQNVEKFTQSSQLKKAVLTSAARHLGGYELQKLREIFESVDANGDGAISKKEFKLSFSLVGERSSEWLEEAFVALDTDASGEIDYSEFLAAIMDSQLMERRDILWAAFQDFDQNNVGSISKENLRRVLQVDAVQGVLDCMDQDKASLVDSILAKVQGDEFGELSFDAFIELLQQS